MTKIRSLLAIAAIACMPMTVHAQDRSIQLHPSTHQIQKPADFYPANGLLFVAHKTGINAKTGAATPLTPALAYKFTCTQIKVETTAATAITAGAAITVGSTGTAADSLLASTTLANTPVVGGSETFTPKAGALVLAAGDVPNFTVATPATGTSQTVAVHLIGYYSP